MGNDQATSLTAAYIVAAQCVMVPVAIVVGRNVERWGTKPIFLVGFGFLATRGVLYTLSNDPWWLVSVQALDGIGAGIFGTMFPVVIVDLTEGTGRLNVAQGAVATTQGLGAALSASLAGAVRPFRHNVIAERGERKEEAGPEIGGVGVLANRLVRPMRAATGARTARAQRRKRSRPEPAART